MKFAKEIIAYAEGKEVECLCKCWTEWMNIKEMRDSALRTFLGIEEDNEWQFRVKASGVEL